VVNDGGSGTGTLYRGMTAANADSATKTSVNTYRLHEEGVFSNGSVSLSSFTYSALETTSYSAVSTASQSLPASGCQWQLQPVLLQPKSGGLAPLRPELRQGVQLLLDTGFRAEVKRATPLPPIPTRHCNCSTSSTRWPAVPFPHSR